MKRPFLSSSSLKLIALVTMTIDHIGMLFFPSQLLWRIIGRVSFPLFAFLIAEGFEKTSDVRKYFSRLLSFAALSQIPYSLFMFSTGFPSPHLNIFFTLSAGLFALILWKQLPPRYSAPSIGLLMYLAEYASFDYGAYGILTILASALFLRFRTTGIISLTLLPLLYTAIYSLVSALSLQMYASMSVPLVTIYNKEHGKHFPRRLLYWFYPVHFLLLLSIWHFI